MTFLHKKPMVALLLWLIAGGLAPIDSFAWRDGTAPAINPELMTKWWSARWITVPESSPFDYGVYHFRRTIDLPAKPASFVVHVKGDNRYPLTAGFHRLTWD